MPTLKLTGEPGSGLALGPHSEGEMKWLTAAGLQRRVLAVLLLVLAVTADLLGVLPLADRLDELARRLFELNLSPPSLP